LREQIHITICREKIVKVLYLKDVSCKAHFNFKGGLVFLIDIFNTREYDFVDDILFLVESEKSGSPVA
jgi:hypothetical protein